MTISPLFFPLSNGPNGDHLQCEFGEFPARTKSGYCEFHASPATRRTRRLRQPGAQQGLARRLP
jgi:hypothetical protein